MGNHRLAGWACKRYGLFLLLLAGGNAFGQASLSSPGGVSSFNTRTGAVTLTSGDVTTALGFTPGIVNSVSVATANGISGTSSGGSTPALTLALGAITPTSVSIGAAPALIPGTGAATAWSEGTVPSVGAAAGVDVLYSDSGTHCLRTSLNNGSYLGVPQMPASFTSGHLVTFNGSTGCLLADGGAVPSPFPFSSGHGSFLGLGWANSSAGSAQSYHGGDVFTVVNGCPTATTTVYSFSPIGGFLRNITGTTSGTNGNAFIRFIVNPGCQMISPQVLNGGAVVPPGAAAGGFIDSWANNSTEWWHVNQFLGMGMGFVRQGNANSAIIASEGAEFISDDGTTDSILGYSQGVTLTVSSTQFLGFGSFLANTELNVAIPIAAPGTLKNLTFSNLTSPTNNVVVTVNKNGSTTALTATIAGGDTSVGNYIDTTHSVSVVAGDYIDLQTVSGASTQTAMEAAALAFVPTTAQTALLWGSFNATTITTTANYAQPFSATNNATEANAEYTFPFACTVSNLYVTQATANGGGVTTTVTVVKNSSPTVVTGTITSGSGTGSILVDGTHSVSFAAGDRMSVSRVTGSGTSGTMGGWGASCL